MEKTIKIIDLLIKIANGEIPKKIYYDGMHFTYDESCSNYVNFFGSEIDWKYTVMEYINDEVEIIEGETSTLVCNEGGKITAKNTYSNVAFRFSDENPIISSVEESKKIEEDKEIEKIEFDEIDEVTDYDIYSYQECVDDSKEHFKNRINKLIKNQRKIIKTLNELKKGK